jgi:queuine tRNA-ribosyltransferase
MLKPGPDLIGRAGGLHRFTAWSGHILTDSGGYQVFSLEPKVDDDGVTFRSTYDGGTHRLTPERAVSIQAVFGSDIQMVLDVCPPLPSPAAVLRQAVDRTADWAARARAAFDELDRPDLNLFGIVQGGTDPDLRIESTERTLEVGFDGYAVGGLSVGEHRDHMLPALELTVRRLPTDAPRYLMGVGDPLGMVEAVARGIDLFDCVLPSRHARHGTILTSAGKYNLRRSENASDSGPLDRTCDCPTCARYSRAYLRHLFVVDEPTAPRLLSVHNIWWTLRLVEQMRSAVVAGTFEQLRAEVTTAYR